MTVYQKKKLMEALSLLEASKYGPGDAIEDVIDFIRDLLGRKS